MNFCFTIPPESDTVRLDLLMTGYFNELSRSRVANLISQGCILVDGQKKRPGYRVRQGQEISGILPEPGRGSPPAPESMDLDIRYEDPYIIVLNKPAGLVVHPAAGNESGTLVNGLLNHAPGIGDFGGDPLRPGIVHRLDKNTSGIMVAAKTPNSLRFLKKEFKYRRVKKQYMALVSGSALPDTGTIDLPIARHPVKRKIMAVNLEAGKPARTEWQVIQRYRNVSLVRIRLHTGRTHQIRVHFYAVGHPLLGDPVYQHRKARKQNKAPGRQMLHAFALSFRHPYSGKKMAFEAEPPTDFKIAMAGLDPSASLGFPFKPA